MTLSALQNCSAYACDEHQTIMSPPKDLKSTSSNTTCYMLQHVPCRGDARVEDGAKSGNFLLFFSTGRARILLGARNSGATT
jgi:hypothetical protein